MARYKKILQGIGQAKFPVSKFNDVTVDLIKSICHVDPAQRLALRPGGVHKNVYPHKFYDASKWDKLECRELRAPYRPRVRNSRDLGNFAGCGSEEDMPPCIQYVDPGTGWDREFGPVEDFGAKPIKGLGY